MTHNKKGSPIHAISKFNQNCTKRGGGFDSVGDFDFKIPSLIAGEPKIYKTEEQWNEVSNLCLVSFEQGIPAQQKYSIHVAKRIISYAQFFNVILTSHYQPLCSYTKDQLNQSPVAHLSTERILICKGSTNSKHIRNIPQCWDVTSISTEIFTVRSFIPKSRTFGI